MSKEFMEIMSVESIYKSGRFEMSHAESGVEIQISAHSEKLDVQSPIKEFIGENHLQINDLVEVKIRKI